MATYRSSVTGADRISADPLGYPWILLDEETPPEPVETQYEYSKPTADWILKEVGNDPDAAQEALDEEEASETPRTSLIAKLERIVRNAES
jgi:hypothetical protein